MPKLRVACQMEPFHQASPGSTSLRMVSEAARRGHDVYCYTVPDLAWREGKLGCQATKLESRDGQVQATEPKHLDLANIDILLIRQDPPFDIAYLTPTWLLEHLPKHVWVINSPAALRNHPEKLIPLHFPSLIPPTLITGSTTETMAFVREHKNVVIKPLYAYGGRGVFHVHDGDGNAEPLCELLSERYQAPWIAQRYIEEVRHGDKRIILLGGEVMGLFWRRPAEGRHQANIRAGGSLVAAEMSARDHEICDALRPFLRENDIFFTGIDVIGNYLTEVNVTSPMGFAQLEQLYGGNPAAQFWKAIEARHSTMMAA